jgi:hypothetical protein
MKFDCGKSYARKTQWHLWFAWYPVQVYTRDCRWLEYVERKGTVYSGYCDSYWRYEYRTIEAA